MERASCYDDKFGASSCPKKRIIIICPTGAVAVVVLSGTIIRLHVGPAVTARRGEEWGSKSPSKLNSSLNDGAVVVAIENS